MPVKRFTISIDDETDAALSMRGDERSATVRREMDRYYAILADAKRRLRAVLTDDEVSLLADACNGTFHTDPRELLWTIADTTDGGPDDLTEKWGVDGQALREKLNAFTRSELTALLDAIEVYWRRVSMAANSTEPVEVSNGSVADILR